MALPIRGIWAARFAQPQAGERVWGTGINPVHSYYGSPAARMSPLRPMEGMPGEGPDDTDITPPHEGAADTHDYQYTDLPDTVEGIYYDNRVGWDVPTYDNPARADTDRQPPYNATGAAKGAFRALFEGAGRTFRGKRPRADYMIPSETVSEGWLNKPNEGEVAVSKPSDPSQYERQTSMQQRFARRTNELATLRATDFAREGIDSRVVRQRSPVYSGQERHVDMFPVQQHPDRERPFYYRTAGTGDQGWLEVNETWDIQAVERTPPPDPYIGQTDTQLSYGYTPEDNFYA